MKTLWFLLGSVLLLLTVSPAHANQIAYISQPDNLAIFLNDIAYAQDMLSVAGDTEVVVTLPATTFPDTLIPSVDGERLSTYRIRQDERGINLYFELDGTPGEVREVGLEYLMRGLSWQPSYDMRILDTESVSFDFYVEIQNQLLTLDDVDVALIAGRVDTSQQIDTVSTITTNQIIVGYDEPASQSSGDLLPGAVTIQNIYRIGRVSGMPNERIYLEIARGDLPARRELVWNAAEDLQANIIYKVRNTFNVALTEGIVRNYEDFIFIGSDFVELTPVGAEGSITVGNVQDLRVMRAESEVADYDAVGEYYREYTVTLTLSNFSATDITLDVVDRYRSRAYDFRYETEPIRDPNNLLRWTVTIPAGEELEWSYTYRTR